MCIFGSSPPPPPKPSEKPKLPDGGVDKVRADEARRRRAAGGVNSTILTSQLGVDAPPPGKPKTLLGG